jgi:hypothetical protein
LLRAFGKEFAQPAGRLGIAHFHDSQFRN